MTPSQTRGLLLKLLSQPGTDNVPLIVTTRGELQVTAQGPGAMDRLIFTLEPETTTNILGLAPADWWLNSPSLLRAVDRGWVILDEAALNGPPPQEQPVILAEAPPAMQIAMAIDEIYAQNQFGLIGAYNLNGGDYQEVRFKVVAAVTSGGLTGEVQLFNLGANVPVVTLSFAGNVDPAEQVTAPLVLSHAPVIYEVRHRVLGGTPPNDNIATLWAGFQVVPFAP